MMTNDHFKNFVSELVVGIILILKSHKSHSVLYDLLNSTRRLGERYFIKDNT